MKLGDGNLGLLLTLAMDATEAQQAVADIGKTMPAAFQKVTGQGTEPLNKSLLNTHQSVHLLAEEAGIHLPRAVVGAVSEMLPSIGQLGGALLAVFAVKELYEFEKGLRGIYDDFDRVAGAERVMRDVGRENIALIDELSRKSAAYALGEVTNTLHRIEVEDAEMRVQEDRQALMEDFFGPMAALIDKPLGKTKELNDATNKLHADQGAAYKLARILLGDEEKGEKKTSRAAEETAKLNREWEFGTKHLAVFGPSLKQLTVQFDGMTEGIDDDVESLTSWIMGMDHALAVLPMVQQHIQGLIHPVSQVNYVLTQEISALKAVAQAMAQDTVAQGELLAAGLAGLVAGRRAQAGVEAVWETARGIALLAEGSWPPNPAAIIAAGLHFESAAQYAIIAGSGSGRRGVPGAGAGSSAAYYGGADRSGSGASDSGALPQTLASGASGVGDRFSGTARVVVFGTDHELQNWVAGAVNRAVQRGVTVQATSSQRGAPVGH